MARRRLRLWDCVTLDGDLLIGGADPGSGGPRRGRRPCRRASACVVLDRHTGEVLLDADRTDGFRHNAICIGGGRLYAIDRPSAGPLADLLKRRGESPTAKPRLVAFDLRTGKERRGHRTDGVFGTWLSYSDKYDVLVEAGRDARDTLSDEPKGMRA